MVNTSKSSLKKTAYKYTYKVLDGKTKKLPIFETIKGKYVVFVDGKRKYVDHKKIVGGADDPLPAVQSDSLLTILVNIPKYFAKNYIIFTDRQVGGTLDLTISMKNFMNHRWSNESQFVHFSNLNKNKEAIKLIINVFFMFFSLYAMWNYEIVFNFFNPDYANRLPRLKEAYEGIKDLITSVPDDHNPVVIGEGFNTSKPLNNFLIQSFFNEGNRLYSDIREKEPIIILLLNLFSVILSVYNTYKLFIRNMKDAKSRLTTEDLNKMAKKLLTTKHNTIADNSSGLQLKGNTVTISNANGLTNKKVLNNLFELYIDDDFVDIQSFENLAEKVDEELTSFLKEKYQYILQPNHKIAIIKKDNTVVNNPQHKIKLESMSKLLHAMHNAQKTHLLSIHDPRYMIPNASQQDDEALRTFSETYKTITGNAITYTVDETTGVITYEVVNRRESLPQAPHGGSKKKTNTKSKNSKKKITSKKSTVK